MKSFLSFMAACILSALGSMLIMPALVLHDKCKPVTVLANSVSFKTACTDGVIRYWKHHDVECVWLSGVCYIHDHRLDDTKNSSVWYNIGAWIQKRAAWEREMEQADNEPWNCFDVI